MTDETITKPSILDCYGSWGVPLRWQDDVTGILPIAVKAFLAEGLGHAPAMPWQVALVRDYCEYYIESPYWATGTEEDTPKLFQAFKELRERIKGLRTSKEIAGWISDCLNLGLDIL